MLPTSRIRSLPRLCRVIAVALLVAIAAPARADKCMGTKLKLVGKKEAGLLGCQAKVASENDSSNLTECETKEFS